MRIYENGIVRDMTEAEVNSFKNYTGVPEETEPVEEQITLTREDFDLLDATASGTIYYITEPNGTITIVKGDNR